MFLRRLLLRASTVDSGLPYNWNWQRRWNRMGGFLNQRPVVLMDVGARGEPPPELASLRPYLRRVGFEPDADEYHRLKASGEGDVFPTVLAGSEGHQRLNLYRDRGYSSVLSLSERYQRLWSGTMPIDSTVELPATTIDRFVAEHPDLAPDMLKLDTQGSELSILQGASSTLARVGLVEVETEFFPLYEGQPLFGDVARFLMDQGFELLYLNRVFFSRRQIYAGPSRGQVLFADALFGKREDRLHDFTLEQRAKYAILLCQYGHLDIAWQMIRDCPPVGDIPGFSSIFGPRTSRPARALLMQLDKLLALALHLRRDNQRNTDSDRSWPIR